jgi:hypothetical protein
MAALTWVASVVVIVVIGTKMYDLHSIGMSLHMVRGVGKYMHEWQLTWSHRS